MIMAEWFGRSLKYTGDKCPNCGRVRVELYENGKRVCEKCQWCIEDEEYVDAGGWWKEEERDAFVENQL